MTKFALWIAALGVSALGSSAVNAQSMTLTSSDINEGATIVNEQVFKGFGCTGGNVSPALSWSGAPSGTKSFAVSIYDPDAPTGSGWLSAAIAVCDLVTIGLPCKSYTVKLILLSFGRRLVFSTHIRQIAPSQSGSAGIVAQEAGHPVRR
jgi:hypothetical protein